jgi:hypothetical protein
MYESTSSHILGRLEHPLQQCLEPHFFTSSEKAKRPENLLLLLRVKLKTFVSALLTSLGVCAIRQETLARKRRSNIERKQQFAYGDWEKEMYILVGLALLVVYPFFLITHSLKEIRKLIPFGSLLLPIWFPIIILNGYLEQGYLWLRQREELYRGGGKRFRIGVGRPRRGAAKPRSDMAKPRAVAKK